jgi:hypothetical protein
MIRTTSPATMSGVTVFQHAPPGWLTSTTPVASDVAVLDVANTLLLRTTANEYGVFGA